MNPFKPAKSHSGKVTTRVKGIYLRNGTYWLTHQHNGERTRMSLGTDDYAVAVVKANEIRYSPALNPANTLTADIERFISSKSVSGDYTRDTSESRRPVLLAFARSLHETATTAQVTQRHVQDYYSDLLARVTVNTANGYMMALRSFFSWSIESARIRRENPCDGIKVRSVKTRARLDFCTFEERDKLIEECERLDLKFVLFCGFHAGMRKQEIIEARPFWFDLDAKMVHLRKTDTMDFKDGEERSIPMTKAFHDFLTDDYPLREPYMLHPEVKPGKSRYRYDFRRPFCDYVKAQGLDISPHVMRHTFASLLASAGVSIYKIAVWLGDDVRTTQRHYAKLLPDHGDIEKAFGTHGKSSKRSRSTAESKAFTS